MSISRKIRGIWYDVDDYGFVQVYTDGSCSNNGYHNAQAGIGIYFGDQHPLNVTARLDGHPQTNNRAEIQAATKAIQIAITNGIKKLTVNTDSHYLIKAMNQWIQTWEQNGWRDYNGQCVKNEHDFRKLNKILNDNSWMDVEWCYVPAHEGHKGNEQADRLAKRGAAY